MFVDADYDLAIQTYSDIWPRFERLGFDGLTRPEQTLFCTWQFVSEVNNGGIVQFFSNPSGEFAEETVSALIEIRMTHAASLLKRALVAFLHPAKHHETRLTQLASLPKEVGVLFEQLTRSFFESPEDPYAMQADYVRKNRDGFPRF